MFDKKYGNKGIDINDKNNNNNGKEQEQKKQMINIMLISF